MIYGYARVSTKNQMIYGNSLEQQEIQLRGAGAIEIYKDAFTGTKDHRPNFDKLMSVLTAGDCLMVTKLDRLARSFLQGSKIVSDLIDKGVRVHILNIGIMDNTPSSKLIKNVFFAFAEFERDMIIERTSSGKEIAKLKPDFREGRPKRFSKQQIKLALELLESHSYKEVEQMTGISKSTLIRAKNKNTYDTKK